MPWVTFTDPEVARAGMTLRQACSRFGQEIEVVDLPLGRVDRALTDGSLTASSASSVMTRPAAVARPSSRQRRVR
ncbi:MAG TPA: hypothetical protein VHF25_13220 [Nitriliruptorales bacterium]|nr:hypothetical protein [Nitriliruptorales bacterium]